jgi:hypothetical protein
MDMRTGREHVLALERVPLLSEDDLIVFSRDPSPVSRLLSSDVMEISCFAFRSGANERLVIARGHLAEFGNHAPSERSELFRELYINMFSVP